MSKKIRIDPITRIEGHMAIEAVVDGGEVKEARSLGTLFRGFEIILEGRDPRDANQLTQRICGVCPIAHATASALCIDEAFGLTDKVPDNARLIRALIFGSNFLQSHVLHFYHLAALDYVDAAAVVGDTAPFLPRYEGDYRFGAKLNTELAGHYLQALDMRRKCHEMLSLFGGKMPHNVGIVPGGVTEKPTEDKIINFLWRLNEIRSFVENTYIPDVTAVAETYSDYFGIGAGCRRFLSYGGFDVPTGAVFRAGIAGPDLKTETFAKENITEDVKHSWFGESDSGKSPAHSRTNPQLAKNQAYSFLKSPRYKGMVCEVGPLARMVINYLHGEKKTRSLVDSLLGRFNAGTEVLFSVLGRHAARAVEAKLVGDAMVDWLQALKPGKPVIVESPVPDTGEGAGLAEAPRGAVGHWMSISNGRIERYQVITPTGWNASPKDDKDQPGPVEQALLGTKVKDKDNPFELVRIVRAFDPCLACSVHLLDARGTSLGVFRVV